MNSTTAAPLAFFSTTSATANLSGHIEIRAGSVATTWPHPDTRFLNRAERRAAGYVRGYRPVGGWGVHKEID